MTWEPPSDLDAECLPICEAINRLPGIATVESCCGHGRNPFHVFFHPQDLAALPPLLYAVDVCHSGAVGWQVIVYTDCSMRLAMFRLEGPVGDYGGAEKITAAIDRYLMAEDEQP